MNTSNQITWGILGSGQIARKFALALNESTTGQLGAIASRSSEKALAFGKQFGIHRCYSTYADLLSDSEIDIVYIALPNHLHAPWAIACAQAGKHILCEKPMALNFMEATQVIEAARDNDVFYMEGYKDRCHPQTAQLVALLKENIIGPIQCIEAHLTFNLGPNYEDIRYNSSYGGGSIMDVGCYTAEFARLVAGCEPDSVTGVGHIHDKYEIDEWATASLHFPNGIIASLICGMQLPINRSGYIWGEYGSICLPDIWSLGKPESKILIRKASDPVIEVSLSNSPNLLLLEADEAARSLKVRESTCMNWTDSLANMALLDSWRIAVGVKI